MICALMQQQGNAFFSTSEWAPYIAAKCHTVTTRETSDVKFVFSDVPPNNAIIQTKIPMPLQYEYMELLRNACRKDQSFLNNISIL